MLRISIRESHAANERVSTGTSRKILLTLETTHAGQSKCFCERRASLLQLVPFGGEVRVAWNDVFRAGAEFHLLELVFILVSFFLWLAAGGVHLLADELEGAAK